MTHHKIKLTSGQRDLIDLAAADLDDARRVDLVELASSPMGILMFERLRRGLDDALSVIRAITE